MTAKQSFLNYIVANHFNDFFDAEYMWRKWKNTEECSQWANTFPFPSEDVLSSFGYIPEWWNSLSNHEKLNLTDVPKWLEELQ